MARRGLSKRKRFEILKRDQFRCRYCGADFKTATLVVDHVFPVALGGEDSEDNLVTACHDCNAGKAGVPLREAVSHDHDSERRILEAVREAHERTFRLYLRCRTTEGFLELVRESPARPEVSE